MRIRYLLVSLFLLSAFSVLAQKVDLDRFFFDVSYLTLPREYIPPADRSFGVRVNIAPTMRQIISAGDLYEQVQIAGFRKVEDRPMVGLTVNLGEVRFEKSETKTRTQDRKDRDGKVTGQDTYYTTVLTYSTSGGYELYGPRESSNYEKRQEEKKQAQIAQNRFLQNATMTSTYTGKLVASGRFPTTLTHTTREFTNLTDMNRYVQQNRESIRSELVSNYVRDALNTLNREVNRWYGYVPYQGRDFLWILDSKSHPEFPIQQEAIKAIKELGKQMSATESVEPLAANLGPVMDYFQELKTKYQGSDKREQKMRYSAYYNLANLYYLLDQPDRAIEEATGLIKNGYDTKDGERFIELAEQLKKDLTKHQMTSRHMDLSASR